MKRKSVWATLLSLGLAALLVVAAAPAQAVVGGQFDGDAHPNVGMLEGQFAPGDWWGLGSCTLVDENIVLTAAHCVDFVVGEGGLGVENVRVTFDPTADPAAPRYYAERIEVNPIWWTRPEFMNPLANSKPHGLGAGAEDEALVWLTTPVTGVTPTKLVAAGGLETLDLTSSTFTIVGYGINGYVAGSVMSWRNPQTYELWSGRNNRDVSVVTEHEAFADRYVKITEGLGFGDSGGPLLYKGVEVAINNVIRSGRPAAPTFSYRLDAPLAQGFLTTYLGPEHFVALP